MMMTTSEESIEECGNCKFYQSNKLRPNSGQCKRYPVNEPKQPNEWCGEHIPQE